MTFVHRGNVREDRVEFDHTEISETSRTLEFKLEGSDLRGCQYGHYVGVVGI